MENIEELEKDLQELETLQKTATRQRTKALLENDINTLKALISAEKKILPQPVVVEEKKEASQDISYIAINKYAWDQEGKNVKIHIGLDEIGQLENNMIEFKVDSESVDLKVHKELNKNWRFSIKKIHSPIDTAKSKFTLKAKYIVITLVKKNDGFWDGLVYKESALKSNKIEKEEDPSKSLMSMMKNLYEDGDEEMKRTIAQAWSKSQTEKGQKPQF